MTWNNGQPLSAYFWVTSVLFVIWIGLIAYCFQRNARRSHSQNSLIEQIHYARNSITNNSYAVTRILQVSNPTVLRVPLLKIQNRVMTFLFCLVKQLNRVY